MAARCGPLTEGLEIVDLRRLTGRELDPLLLEETVEWREALDWDFAKSAELVRHFTDTRALTGSALVDRGEVVGYGYSVVEDQKGLIGDLYIRPGWRGGETDARLFEAIFDGLVAMRSLRRIESQLMLVEPRMGWQMQKQRNVRIYERLLMSLDCSGMRASQQRMARRPFHIEPWGDHLQESAATVIAVAYLNHVDSQINDQYGTMAGARRFIANIVQFPGCGVFFRRGSMVAFDPATGSLAGVVLVSFVASEVGHITQLCVTPEAQGWGLGAELLARAVTALRTGGAKRITLTVTAGNTAAIRLYETFGFRESRGFSAFVWDA